jgi:hypothetical protein
MHALGAKRVAATRFRHPGNVAGLHERETTEPSGRQRIDAVFVFKDKGERFRSSSPANILIRVSTVRYDPMSNTLSDMP